MQSLLGRQPRHNPFDYHGHNEVAIEAVGLEENARMCSTIFQVPGNSTFLVHGWNTTMMELFFSLTPRSVVIRWTMLGEIGEAI